VKSPSRNCRAAERRPISDLRAQGYGHPSERPLALTSDFAGDAEEKCYGQHSCGARLPDLHDLCAVIAALDRFSDPCSKLRLNGSRGRARGRGGRGNSDSIDVVPRLARITRDHRVMGGRPCIRGMRVTVATIVGLLAQGHSRQALLEAYPYLDPEDLSEALAYAAWRTMEVDVEIGER
jgi:uncharacterized protein (DUF433 family)